MAQALSLSRRRWRLFRLNTLINIEQRRDVKTISISLALIVIAIIIAAVIAQAK